jgi:uncharacterized protein YbjT (DUF2867 family)
MVTGVTGHQGGSVIASLLQDKDPNWTLYGLSRSIASKESQELERMGVNIRLGDFKNKRSLQDAFSGIDTLFFVTDAWDPSQRGDDELRAGTLVVDVAKESGIKNIIYSTLCNVDEISNHEVTVPHFTNKALVEEHINTLGFEKTAFVEMGHYFTNWFGLLKQVQGDGSIIFTLPIDVKFPNVDVNLIGPVVREIIKDPERFDKKHILIKNTDISGDDFAEQASRVLGKTCRFNYLPYREYSELGFESAKELADMYVFFKDYGFYGPKDRIHNAIPVNDVVDPSEILTLEEWLQRERNAILSSF